MATVKAKFRSLSRTGGIGTLCYQVCHEGRTRIISTQIYLFPDEWDDVNERIVMSACNISRLLPYQRKLTDDIAILNRIVDELEQKEKKYSSSDVVSRFFPKEKKHYVLDFMRQLITGLKNEGKFGTARNYEHTANSFSTFLRGRDVPFSILNAHFIAEYGNWLKTRNVSRNSSSFYMRILRSVYNKAVGLNMVEQTYPFKNVYTGVDRTRKRAIKEDIIVQMQAMNLDDFPALSLARDLFVFSYCTRGMSFIDMVFLKKQDIIGEIISYCRHKTGQRLSVHVEPCIKYIIKRYEAATEKSLYVFPVIHATDAISAYKQYQTALGYYNRKLKDLFKLMGVNESVSFYAARHTWATAARNHNIPLAVISAGLGHDSERTTQIYLDSMENSLIDQANKNLLSKLNMVSI